MVLISCESVSQSIIPRLLWDTSVQYRVHNISPLDHNLNHMNLVHIFIPY